MIPLFLRNHVLHILSGYKGDFPLSDYLKKYFRDQPKAGSRDRKMVSAAVYCFYRCAKGIAFSNPPEDLLLASAEAALSLIQADGVTDTSGVFSFDPGQNFPSAISFSSGITRKEWLRSMLHQPGLFLRIRNGRDRIEALLKQQNITFENVTENTISLPMGTNADALLPPKSFVVQDASSQKTGEYFAPKKGEHWWDVCAGAGGKSLLLADKFPGLSLTVSDKRNTILSNLTDRFRRYGLAVPQGVLVDAADTHDLAAKMSGRTFDHIICDVPCSGSGTWARTPENFYFFKPETIQDFHDLQVQIVTNATTYLKPCGTLIYITCSVFQSENEDVVNKLAEATGMSIRECKVINGIPLRADCMFVAVLEK